MNFSRHEEEQKGGLHEFPRAIMLSLSRDLIRSWTSLIHKYIYIERERELDMVATRKRRAGATYR